MAFNFSSHRPDDFTSFDALPAWAKHTLTTHEADRRPHLYSREDLEHARTHDALWNAAQTQLVREGWFQTPREALATMEYLMGKYSLDGRDPVSWAGYLWVLGRYDRPWGPERPIFGTVRFMSSENTARKIRVKNYVKKYAPAPLGSTGATR